MRAQPPHLHINNQQINFKPQAKFLGLTFDEYLTWVPHIKNLITSTHKDLNVMRSLSGTNWGANKTNLILIYKTLIRSKIDYGAAIYNTLSPALSKKLDSIQYQALKLAHRMPYGVALEALLALTGELPLQAQRDKLTLNYWATKQHNPLIQKLCQTQLTPREAALNRKNPLLTPFAQRLQHLITLHTNDGISPPTTTKTPIYMPPASLPHQ